jgi:hypothetical protein
MLKENSHLSTLKDRQWRKFTFSGGGGGQILLNFRQNFEICDVPPPPFVLEKTVFSPLLDQNFRKFVNFPEGGEGGGGGVSLGRKIRMPSNFWFLDETQDKESYEEEQLNRIFACEYEFYVCHLVIIIILTLPSVWRKPALQR